MNRTLPRLLALFAVAVLSATASPLPRTTRQVADLKTFLHGSQKPEPAAKPAKAPVVSFAEGVAANEMVATFLTGLSAGLKERNGQPLLPRLADKYRIDGLDGEAKPTDMFLMAIEQINSPRDIVVMAVEKDGADTIAKTEFRWANKTTPRVFRFDAAGKLLYSDFFALKLQTHP